MKQLVKVKGPRDCSLVEVTVHIANLAFQYRTDRAIFEDSKQTHAAREEAYKRMAKARDLHSRWKEVRDDILKKGGVARIPETQLVS